MLINEHIKLLNSYSSVGYTNRLSKASELIFFYYFFCINYIIHCKIKRDNHQVPKIGRVPWNKTNPKKTK